MSQAAAAQEPLAPPGAPRFGLRTLLPGLAALIVVALVLAASWLLNARALSSIEQARQLTVESQDQRRAARDVLEALQDAETGQRGFLLVLQDEYLDPYRGGIARIGPALGRLDNLAAAKPWLRPETAALRQAATAKLAELGTTLRVAREQGMVGALAVVRTGAGKAEMDLARAVVARILARTDLELDRAQALLRARERQAAAGLAVAAILGAALLGSAVVFLLLNRERLTRARAAERLQAARLSSAVEHIRDGVALFDADGRLLLHNRHLLATTGLPPTLVRRGATLAELAAAAAAWSNAPLADLRPGSPARGVETQVGERVLDVWHSPMPDGGQLLTIADITRRTQAETVARQAQKMEALGQLTGGVAHDFNNLLQVISANLELLGDRLALDDWGRTRFAAAQSGVERAARLTRHLLAFARRQPLAPQSVESRAVLGGMEDMLRRTLGERIEIEMVLGGGLWALRADPQQLENALLNLAINARDAMPDGGRLTIEARNAALDDAYAAANAEVAPGQYVVIAVTDTGSGMTAEQLGRALEPFYTTKPEGQGTGLGLPMVFGFAKQSAGHFKLYSEPGHGTTARLYIPRSDADTRPLAGDAAPLTPAEGELVLLVEDDAAVRAASLHTVRGFGYRVVEAANTAAALALLESGLRPDVLFTDVVMPGQPTARQMAERACAMLPDLAVVFTSGYTENSVVHNGKLDSGVILVSKPWRSADLGRKLQQALRAKRQPGPAAAAPMRVLLVEDEMLVRMTTADLLADLGYEVIEAATGAAGLAALEQAPDMLLTDLGLPDMDGLALVRAARARLPTLRVIVASGRLVAPSEAYTVLEKPYDQAAMRRAIQAALGKAPAAPRTSVSG